MANALFVLIVFLLQLNKDKLHIVWPLGVKTNITYIEETSEVFMQTNYKNISFLMCFFSLIKLWSLYKQKKTKKTKNPNKKYILASLTFNNSYLCLNHF